MILSSKSWQIVAPLTICNELDYGGGFELQMLPIPTISATASDGISAGKPSAQIHIRSLAQSSRRPSNEKLRSFSLTSASTIPALEVNRDIPPSPGGR